MAARADGARANGARATCSRRADRHHEAVIAAAVRRLARELSAVGPMPRAKLAQRCAVSLWHDATFAAAIETGIREGSIKQLPFDYLAVRRVDAGADDPPVPLPPGSARDGARPPAQEPHPPAG